MPGLVQAPPIVCVLPLKLTEPLLVKLVPGVMLSIVPDESLTLLLALLVNVVGEMVIVPAVTLIVPLLVNVVGLTV